VVHWENSLSLMARQLEHDMISNLTDAASKGGFVEVPVFKDGQQTYKQISRREYEFERDLDLRAEGDFTLYDKNGRRVPEMQLVKFADAQTMLRTLEAFTKRWRSTQQIDVAYSGIVRLGSEPKAVEQKSEAFDDATEDSSKPKLALPMPGTDATPRPTTIIDKDGTRRVIEPPRDPLLDQQQNPQQSSSAPDSKPLPPPVKWEDELMKPPRGGSLPDLHFDSEGYPCKPPQRAQIHRDPATTFGTDPSRRGFNVC
jgi:hypothetical protein